MKLTRRSILGGLAAAPIAAPAIAKEVVTKAAQSGPWNPATIPFSKHVMDAAMMPSHDHSGVYTENIYSIREKALKAYVLATGKLPDWYVEEMDEDNSFGGTLHNDINSLRSVSQSGKAMIFRRHMRENNIKRAIDRIAYAEDRKSRIAAMANAFYKSLGAK